METFSTLLTLSAENSRVTREFSSQRPVTRSFDIFFGLNKRLSTQTIHRWFETKSRWLWRHWNVFERLWLAHFGFCILTCPYWKCQKISRVFSLMDVLLDRDKILHLGPILIAWNITARLINQSLFYVRCYYSPMPSSRRLLKLEHGWIITWRWFTFAY